MSEKNDNFDPLKQLLKLKRHEIPPPGYFSNFSGDVLSRIRAGEAGGSDSIFERMQSSSPFWSSMLALFTAKPGIIGGLATSVCVLLLVGVVLLDRSDSGQAVADTMPGQPAATVADSGVLDATPALASAVPLAPADAGVGISVNSNPVTSLQPITAFGSEQNPLFQPILVKDVH
jgi:hypothetical protein